MADERTNGTDLPKAQVDRKVFFRKVQTIGGFLVGIAGVAFAFLALLKYENTVLSVLGWSVAALSFGLVYPDQLLRFFSGLFGRGGGGGGISG